MAGFLTGAEAADKVAARDPNTYPGVPKSGYRDFINSQIHWLLDHNVCAYDGDVSGLRVNGEGQRTKVLGWCSANPEYSERKDNRPTSVDWATFPLGYATNYLPPNFYQTYAV